MKRESTATQLVAAGVIQQGDRLLLTKRPRGVHLAGKWEFPGGKVEAQEDPRETVVRECLEECGITVEVGDILETAFHRYPEKTVLILFYSCRLVEGEVRHLGVTDHVWSRASDLDQYELPPADLSLVGRLQHDVGGE